MESIRNMLEVVTDWISRGMVAGPVAARPTAPELPRITARPENKRKNRTGRPVFDRRTALDNEGKVGLKA